MNNKNPNALIFESINQSLIQTYIPENSGNIKIIHQLDFGKYAPSNAAKKSFKTSGDTSSSLIPNVTPYQGKQSGHKFTPVSTVDQYFEEFLSELINQKEKKLSTDEAKSFFSMLNPYPKIDIIKHMNWFQSIGNPFADFLNLASLPFKNKDMNDFGAISMASFTFNIPEENEHEMYPILAQSLYAKALIYDYMGHKYMHYNLTDFKYKDDKIGKGIKETLKAIQGDNLSFGSLQLKSTFYHEFTHYLQSGHESSYQDQIDQRENDPEFYTTHYMHYRKEIEAHTYQTVLEIKNHMINRKWDIVADLFREDKLSFMNIFYKNYYIPRINDIITTSGGKHIPAEDMDFKNITTSIQKMKHPDNKSLLNVLFDIFEHAHESLILTWNKYKANCPKEILIKISEKEPVTANSLFTKA